MSQSDARAAAKRIGEDVELLVAQELDGVELVPDSTVDWYDSQRREGMVAQLPWSKLIDHDDLLVGGESA